MDAPLHCNFIGYDLVYYRPVAFILPVFPLSTSCIVLSSIG